MEIKELCGVTLVVGIILLVGAGIGFGIKAYQIDRDTTAYLDRAQTAGDANTSLKYLDLAIKGFEKHDLKERHTDYIFKKPNNDLSIIYENLLEIKTQLELTTKMNRTSEEYVSNMDDIRGRIRELNTDHLHVGWDANHGYVFGIFLFIGSILAILGVILLCVF